MTMRDMTQRGRYGAQQSWLPIYVLLDCSASMRGAPIEALREGMQLLYDQVMSDGEARSKVKLSIITFATGAQQTPLVPIADFTPPMIQADGVTRLDGALHVLADSIEQDVRLNTTNARGDYVPLVFILTDGAPTDAQGYPNTTLYKGELARLRGFRYNHKADIVAFGCGPQVDVAVLKDITDKVLLTQDLSGPAVRAFIQYVSGSVKNSARAGANSLAATPQGYETA